MDHIDLKTVVSGLETASIATVCLFRNNTLLLVTDQSEAGIDQSRMMKGEVVKVTRGQGPHLRTSDHRNTLLSHLLYNHFVD